LNTIIVFRIFVSIFGFLNNTRFKPAMHCERSRY
jgi:hypothetical protein